MKFLVAFSCILAIAAAKPSHGHLDVALPHFGLEKHGYGYSTIDAHPSVISSPVVAYNAIPAISHHALTYKTIPSISYKTEHASSIVGHKTAIEHQDNTVHHGDTVVQDVAPALAINTIPATPIIHEVPQVLSYSSVPHHALTYKTIPSISYKTEHTSSIVGHKTAVAHQDNTVHHGDTVVQDVAPALAIKTIAPAPIIHEVPQVLSYSSAPVVSHSVIHEAAPLVGYKTEIATPVINHDIVHEIAPAVEVKSLPIVAHHETPIIGYNTAAISPVLSHAALDAHKIVGYPTSYSVAHHSSFGVPAGLAHHGILAAPGAIATHLAVDKTQYHAQDFAGQASYGHSEALQHHHAAQDAAGNKIGSFGWVAPSGQVVGGQYVADALGYRVSSNAIPHGPAPVLDTPEVVAARSAHFAAHAAAHHHLA